MKVVAYQCHQCSHVWKWCDERKPYYCPECGRHLYHTPTVRQPQEVNVTVFNEEIRDEPTE